MNALAYFLLASIAALFTGLRIKNQRQRHQRYRSCLDMDVEVLFRETADPYGYMRRGSVMLNLHRCDDNIKGIVIREVTFSDSAFCVPAFDNLYFKKNNDASQLLSTSFRIRRRNVSRLAGKQLYVIVAGWLNDLEGKKKSFKTRIPYTVQEDQHNE